MKEKNKPEGQNLKKRSSEDLDITAFIDGTEISEIIKKARELYPEAYQKYLDSLKKNVKENQINDVSPEEANEQLEKLMGGGE